MANKKIQRKKAPVPSKVDTGSLWLAGVGAVSLARKNAAALLGELVGEGYRLQIEATKLVRETGSDVQAQVSGLLKPVKARVAKQVRKTGIAIQAGMTGILSMLGIPTKADIDELTQRIGTLSRQRKAR